MNTDFTQIDKSQFECIQNGNSVYFGRLYWVHQDTQEVLENLLTRVKSIKEGGAEASSEEIAAEKAKFVRMRHGVGI
jgi:hypothetical protein